MTGPTSKVRLMSASAHPHPSRRSLPRRFHLLLCAGLAGLGACTTFPDLDARMTEADARGDFPRLQPAEDVLRTATNNAIQPDTPETLEDRMAALNSRAEALRRAGFDADARKRLETEIDTSAGTETPTDIPKAQP